MASSFSLCLIVITVLSQTLTSQPHTLNTDRPIDPVLSVADVHDLLPLYGLPKGLLPDNVKSYSLSADDGTFEIELDTTCYVHFSKLVYYDTKIKGKLSYGKVTEVSGIQAKKAFLWVPVTGIVAHPSSYTVEFQVGFLSEELPVSQFEDIPVCKDKLTQSI